ncbi:MAG: hypothetical protein E7651_03380 [Ruminococcaceae bacterium]|nr:hypothetical protein [Oscillospiraceae bacterium]MBQ8323755.1 hypothetical protein [Clostridia bacterium]
MGFGIAFLGYCFLLLHSAGLGVVAAPLLAYGFFLASRLERSFLYASVASLFMLPRGLFVLLDVFLPILGVEISLTNTLPWLNLGTYLLFFIAWFFMVLYQCIAVRNIAIANDHVKLKNSANRQLYFSSLFIAIAVTMVLFSELVDLRVTVFAVVAYYAVLVMNLYFTHTCLVLITSEKQYEEDKKMVEEHNRQVLERKAKDKERNKKR